MMSDFNVFSDRLKKARQKAKLTQKQLSELSGVTAATISFYESEGGTKAPSLDKVIALAKALNVSIDWLCGLENEIKEDEEIGFDEVMKAIILLSSLKKTSFDYRGGGMDYDESYDISFYDSIIINFCSEYQKIKEFIENEDYPQYLKDGLLQALINKFSNYMVKDGEIIDIDYFDIITDCDNPPF